MFSTIGYAICIPFAALLRLFYNLTGSYGVSLILFTLVIKLILLPFQMKSKKSMVRMSRMSGKMQEIQKKYANNQVKMQEEMQKFYQEEGFNPMSGCLWSFLPLPILMALYYIIREPIVYFMSFGGKEAGLAVVESARKVIEAAGIRRRGARGWLKSFAEPTPIVAPINIIEVFVRPLSLCMRLFGNVLGAFIVMKLIETCIPVVVPLAASAYFDIFDGLLQAYVFVFLTSLFIKEAITVE